MILGLAVSLADRVSPIPAQYGLQAEYSHSFQTSGQEWTTCVHLLGTRSIRYYVHAIFNDPWWRAPVIQVTDEVIDRFDGPGSNPDGDIKLFSWV